MLFFMTIALAIFIIFIFMAAFMAVFFIIIFIAYKGSFKNLC